MKMTVVPNTRSKMNAKPSSGHPSNARPVVQKAVPCLLGVLLGFLLSQYLIQMIRLRPDQDFQTVRIDLAVHKRPASIYPEDSSDLLELKRPTTMSRLETSLLISAILNVIQKKIQQEIESEGFIIAEEDRSEEHRHITNSDQSYPDDDPLTAVEITRLPESGYAADLWLLKISQSRRKRFNRTRISGRQDNASNSMLSGSVINSISDTDPEYYVDDIGNKFDFVEAGQEPTASNPISGIRANPNA